MRKSLLKWFTLIEMIITMIIVGILSVVLIEAYITVSKIALRVEQQKNILLIVHIDSFSRKEKDI